MNKVICIGCHGSGWVRDETTVYDQAVTIVREDKRCPFCGGTGVSTVSSWPVVRWVRQQA